MIHTLTLSFQSNRAGGLAAAFIAELATLLSVYRPPGWKD
jgi:hypothetical protein